MNGLVKRRIQHTLLCNNCCNVLMRSDIKGGVEHVDVLGADGNMVDLSYLQLNSFHLTYLTSSSLFNADLRAIGECGINGTGRNTGIDRNVVLMSDHRQLAITQRRITYVVRTNLVCHIAVSSHTISTKENGVDFVGSPTGMEGARRAYINNPEAPSTIRWNGMP